MGDTDAQALIDAIVANPDDLALWTTYADWLLDRGDMRGKLINLEVARESQR
jgi:uncharacterized protein (TIGR02996 family)